jgi:peptidoglycan/xylan/chitin deacetylase (PgdA/CDA1 family)
MYESLKQNKELWGLFTRQEEYTPAQLDEYGRFLFAPGACHTEPMVSKFFLDQGLRVSYPDNKSYAVCLTHDIDTIYPTFQQSMLSSIYHVKDLKLNKLIDQYAWKLKGSRFSPYRNFKQIMELEERYDAKSSFYFLATERDIIRFRYHIEDLEGDLGHITDKGWEVGLHGGYYTYNDPETIRLEKRRIEKVLNKEVIGYRNHYLRFKVPDTWELLASAGFKYDTTFGYAHTVGFRNGSCYPFTPINLNSRERINITEIPLNIMDMALFESMHSYAQAWETTRQLIDTVRKYNGVITLLWHNNVFDTPYRNAWSKLYVKILEYCQKDAWMTSGEEIWKWWNNGF